jgi:hypothetical protein
MRFVALRAVRAASTETIEASVLNDFFCSISHAAYSMVWRSD